MNQGETLFEIAPHLIAEAKEIAVELTKNHERTVMIRSTGFYVTVDPDNKTVLHRFECDNTYFYITMAN